MKKRLLPCIAPLLLMLLAIFIFPGKNSAQWVVKATIPLLPGSIFNNQISAVNDSVVWVYRNNNIFKTTDGGTTWKRTVISGLEPNFTIAMFCAIDGKTALIAGYSFNTLNYNIVYRTTNGGNTWEEVFKQTGLDNSIVIAMRNKKDGIMSVETSTAPFLSILKTADGGKTWGTSGITTPKTRGGIPIGHHSMCVVGNNIWFGTNTFKVFHSADFGLTWSSLAKMPGFPGVINSVSFQDSLNGIVSVTNSDGVNITHDGGVSWEHTGQPVGPFFSFTQTALLAGNEGWFIPNAFDDFQIFHSVDNGNTWNSQFKDSVPFILGFYDLARSPHFVWTFSQLKIYSYALPVEDKNISGAVANDPVPAGGKKDNLTCYPNPAAGITNIQFSIAGKNQVSLIILNEAGMQVAVVANKFLDAGAYQYQYNFSPLPAGVYYCSLNMNNAHFKTKIVHTKN